MTGKSYRRRVVDCDEGYRVHPGDFTTTDRTLAVDVARRLDRDDPLPCDHDEDLIQMTAWGMPPDRWPSLCQQCGRMVDPD